MKRSEGPASLLDALASGGPDFTLMRFAASAAIGAPAVDGVAAFVVLSGTLHLTVAKRPPMVVEAGRLALLPHGLVATLASADPVTTVTPASQCLVHRDGWLVADAARHRPAVLMVGAARIAGSRADALSEPLVTAVTRSATGRSLFAMLRNECAAAPGGHSALAGALMNACVVQGLRHAMAQAAAGTPSQPADGAIRRVIGTIRSKPSDAHSVDTLARIAGMSRSTFVRHFRRALGSAPGEYVQNVRLDEAAAMLNSTDLAIKAIAAHTGFASRSHFSRAFRAKFGRDPSSFRDGSLR